MDKVTKSLYLLQCPYCKRQHPLLLYPYEGIILCACGATIGNIRIGEYTEFETAPAGYEGNQNRIDKLHFLDDKMIGAINEQE